MRTRITEQETTVEIVGTPAEIRSLYEELHTWTPSGGWSSRARQFFDELRRAGGISDVSSE